MAKYNRQFPIEWHPHYVPRESLTVRVVLLLAFFLAGLLVGRVTAPKPVQPESAQKHMNDLMSVGFTMFDPEGHKIDFWEETP